MLEVNWTEARRLVTGPAKESLGLAVVSGPFIFFTSSDVTCTETGDPFNFGTSDFGEGEVVGFVGGDEHGDWGMS